MIYKNSYFRKEMRQAYIENQISQKRIAAYTLFTALLAFALHFVLQTLVESVLADTFPHIMQTSYFSTVYTYILVAYILYALYFIIYYPYLSFAEIRKNRWYLLVKMGYRPERMIFSKLLASIYSLFLFYTCGFIVIVALTVFLKYNFIYQYFPSLYVFGFVDLAVVTVVAMTISLYVKNATNARYAILFSAFLLKLVEVPLGYYSLTADRVLMQDFSSLFNFQRSLYLPLALAVVLSCVGVCIFRAKSIAKYYTIPYSPSGDALPENVSVVRLESRTGKFIPLDNADRTALRAKIFDVVTTALLVVFICAALAFNLLVIIISTSQPGKEITIEGIIPYIFKSDTMESAIMENDLAYFRRVDTMAEIRVDDIVLFQVDKAVYVERVKSVEDGQYTVDIDYYPPMSQEGAMIKTVDRSAIYGVYTDSNRWLGALILFANTVIGRLVFLLVPAFLLFFYKPLRNFFAKNAKGYVEET